ncbi:hypothetical protein PAPHI01_2204 [Pancytospora philotis]|nr:hypothetical protein PAPHI01_2204 [Pancytospora philotis]
MLKYLAFFKAVLYAKDQHILVLSHTATACHAHLRPVTIPLRILVRLSANPQRLFCPLMDHASENINMDAQVPAGAGAEEMQAPAEVTTVEQFLQLVASKSFKDRILAYGAINRFPEHVGLLQNETLAPGIDALLDALLVFKGELRSRDIAGLLVHAAHSKTSIKTKLNSVVDRVLEDDRDGLVESMCALLGGKNAKLVERMVAKLSDVLRALNDQERDRGERKAVAGVLTAHLLGLLNATDPSVKRAAVALCVEVYRVLYDGVYKFIGEAKPILLKELKDEFAKYVKPREAVSLGSLRCDDPNWKERLESLNVLRDSLINPSSGEITMLMVRRLKDANIRVVQAAVECVRSGKVASGDVVRAALSRLKDKKPALSALIKETVEELCVDPALFVGVLTDREQKNPDVRIGVLDLLIKRVQECGPGGVEMKETAFLLDDSNAEVRSRVAHLLSLGNLAELKDEQVAKIQKLCKLAGRPEIDPAEDTKANVRSVAMPTPAPKEQHSTPVPSGRGSVEIGRRPSLTHGDSPSRSVDDLLERYQPLQDRDWNKKLLFLKEQAAVIRREPLPVLVEYVVQSKESNFNILKELLVLLAQHEEISRRRECVQPLCNFLAGKVSESKLRAEVVGLYAAVGVPAAVDSLLHSIQGSLVGKRFTSCLEVLAQLLRGCSDEAESKSKAVSFISRLSVSGMPERSAVESFKSEFGGARAHPETPSYARVSAAQPVAAQAVAAPEPAVPSEYFIAAPLPKMAERLEDAFTPKFLALMETDPYSALRLLAGIDQISISGTLIRLYSAFCLPAVYFNSLVDYFILNKYILLEKEAALLVAHCLGNAMEAELEMIDRIYPATRLYALYRAYATGKHGVGHVCCSLDQIVKLLSKYRKIAVVVGQNIKKTDFIEAIRQHSEFVSLAGGISELLLVSDNASASSAVTLERKPTVCPTSTIQFEPCKQDECLPPDDFSDIEDSFIIEEEPAPIGDDGPADASDSGILRAPSILKEAPTEFVSCIKAPTARVSIEPKICPEIAASPEVAASLRPAVHIDLEDSLANISITTTPKKKKRDFAAIDSIMDRLTHSDAAVSREALVALSDIASTNIASLLFLSNSIVSSIAIQLFDKYADTELRQQILRCLLKLTQNTEFTRSLRYETLKSITSDLTKVAGEDTVAADTLINLCLNGGPDVLRAYFDLLENGNLIIIKLIWKHSKCVDYTAPSTAQAVVTTVDSFYQRKGALLSEASNMVLKVCLLHLKDCCMHYSDGIKRFNPGRRAGAVIDYLLSGKDLNLDEIRGIFK